MDDGAEQFYLAGFHSSHSGMDRGESATERAGGVWVLSTRPDHTGIASLRGGKSNPGNP